MCVCKYKRVGEGECVEYKQTRAASIQALLVGAIAMTRVDTHQREEHWHGEEGMLC